MTLHDIGCDLDFDVDTSAVLVLQIAAARTAGRVVQERLVAVDGAGSAVEVVELPAQSEGRMHLVSAGGGPLHLSYAATLDVEPPAEPALCNPALDYEAILALRPSRYCPSDAMAGLAASMFPIDAPPAEIARTVSSWVFEHVALTAGASGPTDSAIDTLLAASGVCRDFAHLTIALCRACSVPARFVSVYSPGLSPMDFHAVVEVSTDRGWEVLDATRRAPRSSLVRISTGRDAADAAFATTVSGQADLVFAAVSASTDAALPADDHISPFVLR
jgi:transglutaminase-like putative cysteine protease